MTEVLHPPGRLLRALTVLAVVLTGQAARAQQDDGDLGDEVEAVVMPAPAVMFQDQNFDQWIFGGGKNAAGGRSKFDAMLSLRLEEVNRLCGLTDAQRKKLGLAGRGDIKRFFDQVEEKRRAFRLVRNDQNKVNQVIQEIQPLRLTFMSGLFGDGSIFVKTLKKTLDDAQAGRYDRAVRDKARERNRARVELAVASIDDALGLTSAQRTRLVALLLEHTLPSAKPGPYDMQVLMIQASRLPEATLRSIFGEDQWKSLKAYMDQTRRMEPFLRQNGYLPAAPGEKPAGGKQAGNALEAAGVLEAAGMLLEFEPLEIGEVEIFPVGGFEP
jgi:hypothetical protein